MATFSYARLLLEHWGVSVEDIPTSDKEEKQEADFIATFSGARVLIEEKTKKDNSEKLAQRSQRLEKGEIYSDSLPLVRNETLSGIIRDATKQLRSSSDKPHEFRLMWFTGTGVNAQAKYKQFIATLYGLTNIIEMNSSGYRRCYFFRNSDFYRCANVIDGAVAAYVTESTVTAKFCLNTLSPRYTALQESPVLAPFGTAVEDPFVREANGNAFILDSELNRKNEGPLLRFLQKKYNTGPLMKIDLGYIGATLLIRDDER